MSESVSHALWRALRALHPEKDTWSHRSAFLHTEKEIHGLIDLTLADR
jgi:hypothetical protein